MQKKIKWKYKNIIIASFFLSFFVWNGVFAQEELPEAGLQVSPLQYDWKMKSGEIRTDDVIVHNFSDVPHAVEVSIEDFYVSDDSRQANFYIPEEGHELAAHDVINWVSIPENFILQPDETKKMKFSIAVPEDQPTNGYYGAIFFKTSADDAVAENESGNNLQLGVNYRVGALITLAVQGEEDMHISGSLEEFNVLQSIFYQSPLEFYAKLKSEGNVHYQVDGRIEVYKFGKKFATVMIEPKIMYPDTTRTFTEKVQFGPFDYGIYSAKLEMESEDSSVVFEDEVSFFVVIPWIPTLAIAGIILFVIILVKLFKRKYALVKKDNIQEKKDA